MKSYRTVSRAAWTGPLLSALLCLCLLPTIALADLRLASWNIQHLGWDNNKHYPALALIASHFDFLAIQEVMNAQGIYTLRDTLAHATREPWEVLYSEPMGRSSYREKYAFLWRQRAVEYIGGALIYLDDADRFAREPFSAVFRSRGTGQEFLAANVHITHGQRIAERAAEVRALRRYWDWLAEVQPEYEQLRLLFGDFNLPPWSEYWAMMLEVAEPLITEGATTLSTHDRRYANLYDNVWVPRDHVLPLGETGILQFPILLTELTGDYWDHRKARDRISDHAPVYVLFQGNSLHDPAVSALSVQPTAPCIDINDASLNELTRLPHIGKTRAKEIKAGRPWSEVDELSRIKGIGEIRLRDIQSLEDACVTR